MRRSGLRPQAGDGWCVGRRRPRANVPLDRAAPRQPVGRLAMRWGLGMLTIVVLVVSGVSASRLAARLLMSWLEVHTITVSGTTQVTRQEVLRQMGLGTHESLLSLDLAQLQTRLMAHVWIKDATVRRRFPGTLQVEIVEHHPAALVRAHRSTVVLNEEGQVLVRLETADEPSLPILVGLNLEGLVAGEPDTIRAARVGIQVGTLLASSFDEPAEVNVRDPEHAIASVSGFRFQFGSSPLAEQWERYRQLEAWVATASALSSTEAESEIDLRYPGKVIVREHSPAAGRGLSLSHGRG